MKKLKKFEPVEILWDDATHDDGCWKTQDEYIEWRGKKRYYKQIGYFIEYFGRDVIVCSGFAASKATGVIDLSGITTIPVSCVRKMWKRR